MRTRQRRIVFARAAMLLLACFMIAGCGTATTTGEFQKEAAPATTSTGTSSKTTVAAGKIEGYEIYENKDPFQPLYGPGATTRTVTTTTTTTGTAAGGGTTTTTTTAQTQVKLIAISNGLATINTGGTDYTDLKAGDTFAGSYKVLTIGTGSVTILYGDNQYTLYLGETISVK